MDFKAVVLDTGVWINFKGNYEALGKFDDACRKLGIEVLVPATVFNELVGCHINEAHRRTNLVTLSHVRHKFVPDFFFILDETPIELGRLTSELDADTYLNYRPGGNVRKKRDFVIAKTAEKANAKLIWVDPDDKKKLIRNGIPEELFTTIDAILNEFHRSS